MADSIVGAVINFVGDKLLQCIAEPIKRRFNYLRHYDSNIQKLRGEKGNLEVVRDGLKMQVNTAKDNAEVILPEVDTWFEDVDEILVKMTGIESEITRIQCGCFAVKSRLSLSKKAEDTAGAMRELQGRYHSFNRISNPAAPAAAALVPLGSTYDFQSRKDIEEDIMKALREFNMVGICGMGGVGKTTTAKRIMNRLKGKGQFDETVMVVVSQIIDMLKIQNEIAEQLNLKLEGESLLARAHKLRTRLTGGKRVLIILDDIWEKLELKDLGIPCEIGLKECKVLFTSRDRAVLNKMNAEKVCEMQTLTKVEAWSLFREKVGTCVDDDDVHSIAQEVVQECKGLPIALVTIGMALNDQKDISIWKDVRHQLKYSNPEDMPELLQDVYKPLKVSYDKLESDHAKYLFLLCCLFPEDANIPISELSYYVMGLGMLEEITNVEPTRNRICSVVDRLKKRFLLLEGWNENLVKMHDVVRDVAIFIASKERQFIKCGDKCTWFSPFVGGRMELPMGNLRLLSIDNSTGEKLQINNNFFEGMTRLNVLSINNVSSSSLPDTIQLLKNLRTLILHSCGLVETISVVGELVNLEILSCLYCASIENLPREIGQLDRLKVLEFLGCAKLKTIEPGIIQKLVGLEEFKMVYSFDKWEAENNEGKKRKNAGLKELQSLHNLTYLEIEVEDFILAAEQISLPSKIVNFWIAIDDKKRRPREMEFKKQMKLNLPREITLGDWIHQCVRGVECLDLAGDGSNYLDLRQAQSMKSLTFVNSSTVKKLVNITSSSIGGRCGTTVFPRLEYLSLHKLINLEEIYDIDGPIPDEGSGSKSFKNLKKLRLAKLPALKHLWKNSCHNAISLGNLSSVAISKCHNLRNLFSWGAMENVCLLRLESLDIHSCNMMEQIFLWNEEENKKDIGQESHHITFPKLKKLRLRRLPNLTTFCQGTESIEFPLLTKMEILCCPQLKCLVSNTTSSSGCCNNENNSGGVNNDRDHDADSPHLFCRPEKVAFGSLKTLVIRGYKSTSIFGCHQIPFHFLARLKYLIIGECGGISLFSSSVAENLVNLRGLGIWGCEKMVKVIEDENNEKDACGGVETTNSLFPKLKDLCLINLPNLKSFCEWRCALEFPSLKELCIEDCPEVEKFSLGSLTTQNLEEIEGDVDIKTNEDLNGALQRRLVRVKEEREEKRKKRQEEEKQEKESEGAEREGAEEEGREMEEDSETDEYIVSDSETEEEEI